MSEHLDYAVLDGVATITIDRPERRNALTYAMYDGLADLVARSANDPAVRSIVLTGVPGQFCAGTDLTELETPDADEDPRVRDPRRDGRVWFLWDCSKPIVAAIDGPAVGLGVELASQCDIRVASNRARFSWIFVRRGLIPDTGAGTWLLPRLIGPQHALRLVLSGDIIDADEAKRLGFLLDVVEPEQLYERAHTIATSLGANSPFAAARAKALILRGLGRTREEHLAAHIVALTACQLSDDHKEGVAAFLEKRDPQFTGT